MDICFVLLRKIPFSILALKVLPIYHFGMVILVILAILLVIFTDPNISIQSFPTNLLPFLMEELF